MTTALGRLATTNQTYKQLVREQYERINPAVVVDNDSSTSQDGETVKQKRKRLFNKDTGSLQLDLTGVPFWVWDESLHYSLRKLTNDHCCFVDMVGRPTNPKTGEEMPLFPYELEVIRALFEPDFANPGQNKRRHKHLWIKKARGAGTTELFIYLMLYLALAFPKVFYDSQMAIVTGIRKQTAVRVMQRMKHKLYQKLKIHTDFNESVLDINGCLIQAYPIKNPDSYRGLHNLKVLFFDEADYIFRTLIDDTFAVAEGFWAKNDPYTIFNSTARKPGGLMQQIEDLPDEQCNYKRIYLLADKLLGYIYTQEDLDKASTSQFYRQEYWGEYQGEKGNLFPQEYLDYAAGLTDVLIIRDTMTGAIRRTIQRPEQELTVRDVISDYRFLGIGYQTSIGTDPGFYSSMFASVVMKEIEGIIYVVKEVELFAPSQEEGIRLQKQLMYQDYPTKHPKVFIDSSAVSFVRAFKEDIKEYQDYHKMTHDELVVSIKSQFGMTVCPVSFGKYGDGMNYQLRRLMELGLLRIDKELTPNLWLSMNSAKFDEVRNKFNKKDTTKNDVYDAGRLASINFPIGNIGVL